MVCAHVGSVSREGQPGGLCVAQTAVLGQGVAEEKSQAAWKGSELAKRFCGVFCMPLPFVFSGHILLPFPEPRGRIGLSLWVRWGLSRGLVSGLSQFLPSPQLAPPGDPVAGGQVIGVQGGCRGTQGRGRSLAQVWVPGFQHLLPSLCSLTSCAPGAYLSFSTWNTSYQARLLLCLCLYSKPPFPPHPHPFPVSFCLTSLDFFSFATFLGLK